MVYGTDEYFESGGRGHNIYFTIETSVLGHSAAVVLILSEYM
jgi:hypothetical protein